MKKAAVLYRYLSLIALLAVLIQPLSAMTVSAQTALGDLQIVLTDGGGSAVGGACFSVVDANGNSQSVCTSGDGTAYVSSLPTGDLSVTETSGPDGYNFADTGYATITDGGVATVNLTSTAIPVVVETPPTDTPTPEPIATDTPTQEPVATDTPTQEPVATDTPTQEPAATETPTSEATATATATGKANTPTPTATSTTKQSRFAAAADSDLFNISCSYNTTTNLSTFTFTLTKASPTDPDPDPALIINFSPFDNNMNPVAPSVSHTYTTTFTNQPWRQLDVSFTRPDGVTGQATASCNTSQNTTTVTTVARTSAGVVIPNGTGVPAGTAIKDTATLSGNTINAGGSATYRLYAGSVCTGTPVFTTSVTVANGLIPDSSTFTPATPGIYNWQVTYNGDSINKTSTSACGTESLIVGKVTPTITTAMTTSTGATVADDATLPSGTQVRDLAILAGTIANAGGTVTYNLYAGTACTGTPVFTSTQNVTNGVAVQSGLTTQPAGTYNWQVVYSGDAFNNTVTSACGTETFTINKTSPSVTTTMKNNAGGGTINDGATVPTGTVAFDTAVLTGATSDAGGTVTYNLYAGTACSGTPAFTSGPLTVTNGVIPNSGTFAFNTAGTYEWQAVYSGDAKNNAASSSCNTETMIVGKNSPTITTVMKSGSTSTTIPDQTSIALPVSIRDTATLSGASATPTGTVTYKLFLGTAACGGTALYTVTLNLNGDGTLPDTPVQSINTAGIYNWQAVYNGDVNNNAATATCGSETFFAGKLEGTIATQVKKTSDNTNVGDGGSVAVGTAIYDTATIGGVTPNAGGAVTYKLYPNSACTAGTEVFTSTVTMATGTIPNSTSFTLVNAGTYDWQVSYAGDANNAPVTSTCGNETVVVTKVTPTVTTTMKNNAGGATIADGATVPTGTVAFDTAVLGGASATPTGTVTYNLYTGTACTGTPTFTTGALPLNANGTLPNSGTFTFAAEGTYNWQAVYSGDANNNAASSSCQSETMIVSKLSPTITTVMKSGSTSTTIPDNASVALPVSIRDTATLSGASTTPTGTVIYNLYLGTACTGTPVYTSGALPLNANGTLPDTPVQSINTAGTYNWQAVYSGDANNNPATSSCGTETFFAGQIQGTIATQVKLTSNNNNVADGGTVALGAAAYDTATINGATPNAGGAVTYRLYAGTTCTGTPVHTSTVTMTNTTIPQSTSFTFANAGTYEWQVSYAGDANNAPATSTCGAETVVVNKVTPTVTTTMKNNATGNTINDGATVATGTVAFDTAVLGGASTTPTGTVTYNLYTGTACTGTPTFTSGALPLNANGTLPNSGTFTFANANTYNWQAVYSGDANYNTASSNCGAETMIVGKNSPTITTVMKSGSTSTTIPDNSSIVTLPVSIRDTATLSGASATPTGTVTYKLFQGAAACGGTALYTVTLNLNGDGTLPDSAVQSINTIGIYNWQVTYNGDTNNNASTSGCGDETFFAGKLQGNIATQVKKTSDNSNVGDGGSVALGTAIYDTATIGGVTPNAGGAVTYKLYPNSACTAGTEVFTSTVTMAGGIIPNSTSFTPVNAGNYDWQVSYAGDTNNAPVTSTCGNETVVVTAGTTTISTVMKTGAGATINQNSSILVPFTIYDTATLSGVSATAGGTVTYNLYANTTCTGATVFSSGPHTVTNGTVPNSGQTTITNGSVYNWQVVYSGDANNNGSTSTCGSETVFGKVQPTLSTVMQLSNGTVIPDDGQIALGSVVRDTATLTGATATAAGSVTYNLYYNSTCTGTPVYTSGPHTVTNAIVPNSGTFTMSFPGTYNWQAVYTGTTTDNSTTSTCGTETFTVTATPAITTVMKTGSTSIAQGASILLPKLVFDTALLSGVSIDAGGTVKYELFKSTDCSGTAVFTSTQNVTNHIVPDSASFNATTFGTYNWKVTYSGDANNAGAVSACGQETFVGVENLDRTITIDCAYNAVTGNSSFRVIIAKLATSAPDYDPALNVIASPFAIDNTPLPAITYHNYDTLVGPNNPNFIGQPWRSINLSVTWPDGVTGQASAGCNSTKLQPSITTKMVSSTGATIANGTILIPGAQIGDTVTLTGGTVNPSGSITYKLYNSSDCSGQAVFTDLEPILTPGVLPPSSLFTLVAPGPYNWVVSYSGDTYNLPVTSACGTEFFTTGKNTTSITTTVKLGNTTIADGGSVPVGSVINDTAVLTGATATAGGTVTYKLYASADCSGDPLNTFNVTVTNGIIPPSPTVTLSTAGTYNWVVSYSGDAANLTSTSACGAETVLVTQLKPSITTTVKLGETTVPDGGSVPVGSVINDTAVLSGATATAGGTVTYKLYASADCSGTALNTFNVTVTNGVVPASPTVTLSAVGTYNWVVSYSGDANNEAATSACGAETVLVTQLKPSITTTVKLGETTVPDGGSVPVGSVINDTAVLSGATATAGGTVTYKLYASADCSGTALNTFNVTVTNGVVPASPTVTLSAVGTYNWVVSYSGDANNEAATSACGAETVLVTQLKPSITTTVKLGETTVPDGGSVPVGSVINDTAVLSGATATAGGTVTYKLYASADCSGTALNTFNVTVTNGVVPASPTVTLSAVGTYNWVVSYSGDANNEAATSACGAETVLVTQLKPSITTTVKLGETTVPDGGSVPVGSVINDTAVLSGATATAGGTVTYKLYASADCSGTALNTFNVTVTNGVVPASPTVTLSAVGTYNWVVSYSGDANNEAATSACGAETVLVTQLKPSITTTVKLGETTVPDGGSVPVGSVINDTAVLTGATATAGGTVTYKLYASADCSGTALNTFNVTVTNGVVPASPTVTLSAVGTYNWVVSYSGDANNEAATSACGAETVLTTKLKPSIATVLSADTISTGGSVNDTAKLTGATADAGGTVTYYVYSGSSSESCTEGNLKYTLGPVNVTNGVVANSPSQIFTDAGNYQWQAVYSGDAKNEGATSACGTEPLTVNAPKLSIIKTSDTGETLVSAGDTIGFTITVTNAGPGTATGVTLSDPLPTTPGLSWVLDTANSSAGCTLAAGVVNCTARDLAAAGTIKVHVTSTTTAASCTTINNTATYNSTNGGTDSASASVVVNCPDIKVTKVPDNATVNAGDSIGFTMVVTNNGPGVAKGVTLSDTLPVFNGASWSISPAVQGCAITAGVLNCSFGDMGVGVESAKSVHLSSTTTAESCGVVTNKVDVAATNEPAANTNNNSATATVTVNCPDVTVTKVADAGTVSAGDQIGFTMVVTNNGPGVARSVTLTDTLPVFNGASWSISPAVQGCTITAGVLNCSFGDMGVGVESAKSVHLISTTTGESCGTVPNAVSVAATNEPKAAQGNNSANASITVNCPNVTVVKTAVTGTISAGDNLVFSIVVRNIGTGIARGVTLTDQLPAGIQWTSSNTTDCSITAGTLNCAFGDLTPQASRTITLTGQTDAQDCGTVPNTAVVAATNEPRSANGDNSSTASAEVLCPDIAVVKVADEGTINAGDTAAFNILISNIGRGIARNVTLTDVLPGTIDWQISPLFVNCSITTGVLNCNFGDLQPGGFRLVRVTGVTRFRDCGLLSNTAIGAATNEPRVGPSSFRPTAFDIVANNNESTATISVNCSQLEPTKIPDADAVSAGTNIGFTISLTNRGAGDAEFVHLSDLLPIAPGLNWTIDGGNAVGLCNIANGQLTCELGTVKPNTTLTVHLSSPTTAASCGVVNNVAQFSAENAPDASASGSVTVRCPNVTILKTAGKSPINAGETISFSILVSNIGLGDATGVTVQDTLPTGIAWSEDSDSCSIAAGTLSCNFGTLPAREQRTVTLTGTAPAAVCGTVPNTATVSATNEPASAGSDNSSSATVTVNCPDLEIVKTAVKSPINAGDTAGFTIKVTNIGVGEAKNVTITDQLPAGITWTLDPAVQGCSITSGTLNCTFDTLASGASINLAISGETDAADCGTLTNTATTAASNEPEDQTGNNTSTATMIVNCPDLKIEKTAPVGVINAGDTASFKIVITNLGPGTAYDATMTDTLPAGITWSLDPAVEGCSITDGVLSCTIGDLEANGTLTLTVTGTTDAADCGTLTNTATTSASNEPEDHTGNNTSTATMQVNCPDLKIVKTAVTTPINAGDTASFKIVVTNLGPGTAYDVTVTDSNLPTGIDWQLDPAVEGCTLAEGTLSCTIDELAANATLTVIVSGETDAADCGELTNTATTSASNEPEDHTGNNTSTATMQVNCPDLKIEKTADSASISAGDVATFNIKVTNLGPGTAYDVVMTDTLPAGINWSIVPAVTACSITDGVLTCSIDELAANGTLTISISGETDSADCGTITNTATTSASNEPEDHTGNNTSTATMTVNCPDLKIEKTAPVGIINAGDTAAFNIKVTNLGPGTAYDVVVSDTLPTGITWTINPAVEGCSITDGVLTCSIDELAAEGTLTLTVTGETDAADCGTLTNTATTSASNEPEDHTGNNTSTATMQVNCPDLKIEKTAGKASISAGDDASFTIKVTNLGPGTAYDVEVTDTLPTGIAWAINPAVENCAIADGKLTCSIDELAANGTLEIAISGKTDAADCGTLSNTATTSASNEPSDHTGNNSSTATMQVNCPDLKIVKTALTGTINAGDTASFKIVITNIGKGTAYDVQLNDQLPAGVNWAIDPAVTGCAIANGALTCSIDELAPEATLTVIITGETDAADCGELINTATTSASNEPEDHTGNNSSTATMQVNCPDIEVVKTADDAVVVAGGKVGFGITVSNIGAGTAYGTTVTDNLPAGVAWAIDSDSPNCSITGSTLSCSYAELASGASESVHVSGTTDASDCGLMTNVVNVTATNEADSATGNNRAYANVTIACDNIVVAKYICVTDQANASVEFVVTTPRGDDGSRGCAIGPGVKFTITGDNLDAPIHLTTGENGQFTATLLSGTYTLTEDSTKASVDFEVVTNQPTLINVYNLNPEPTVEVTVIKLWCKSVKGGVLITVNEDAAIKHCSYGSTIVQLDGGTPFRINDNGTITILVTPGDHTISEPSANASKTFTATPGSPVTIRIYNELGKNPPKGPALPDTGSGSTLDTGSSNGMMSLAMLAAALMLAGIGLGMRRRPTMLKNDR